MTKARELGARYTKAIITILMGDSLQYAMLRRTYGHYLPTMSDSN